MPDEVPRRVAPASIIASAVGASRMPPAAFTPNFSPTISIQPGRGSISDRDRDRLGRSESL